MEGYCTYCGNVTVPDTAHPCEKCNKVVTEQIPLAHKVWLKLKETDRMCCGRLVAKDDDWDDREPHLYFHGKYWDDHYPSDELKEEWMAETTDPKNGGPREYNGPEVSVECGVKLYADMATTYYLYDTDSCCGAVDFGEEIPLPNDPDNDEQWEAFHQAIHAQLSQSAEAAWDDDWSNCDECGYHQSACDPHVHQDEDEDEEEEQEEDAAV